jgi:hypothetical protein
MRVDVVDRLDGETIICKVEWNNFGEHQMMRFWVPVKATLDEYNYHATPTTYGKGFSFHDVPTKPDKALQLRAVAEAQKLAERFANATVD